MVLYLTLKEILRLHYQVIEDFGGSHGVRDESRLHSIEQAPAQDVFGQEQYPGIFKKSAVYARNIIGDHPFADGNKRTGIICAVIFLNRNGIRLTATPRELEDFAMQIATDKLSVSEIATWFNDHAKK
ncbi:MAG: type II toxin-antitoxin system death-on-curing family toxin [bacterium]|nr:type II toxin-antitoxin system death-on-curing family toxin [bacterium]